jgi:hypothetical protein
MKKQTSKARKNDTWETISTFEHPYSFKGEFPADSSKLQRRVSKNPMAALFECAAQLQQVHEGFRDDLYNGLQYGYAIARHLSMNPESFKEFYSLPFFQSGKRKFKCSKQQKNTLRHVMNYLFNATSVTARKRTGKYSAALNGYMHMGMPAHIVAAQIKADGGIEKLYEISIETEANRAKRVRAPKASPNPDFLINDEPVHLGGKASKTPAKDWSLDGLEGDPRGDVEGSESTETDNDQQGDLVLKHGRDPKGRPTVSLEVTPKTKARLLGLKEGERMVLRIEGRGLDEAGDPEEWVRLRVKHAFQWPPARSKLMMH